MHQSHKKQNIKSKYRYNSFAMVDELYPVGSEAWERANIVLTKFQQRTFYNDFVLENDGEVRYVYTTLLELRILLGEKKYNEILNTLIDNNVILRVDTLNPNNPTQTLYTFEAFRETPKGYNIRVTNKRVHNSLNRFYDSKQKQFSPVVRDVILPNLRKSKIEITDTDYWTAVQENYSEYCTHRRNINKSIQSYERYVDAYKYLLYRIRTFNSATGKEIYDFITEDNFSKRVHTIITQLPKFLRERNIIRLNGESVCEIDLAQSQPTILAKVLEGTDYYYWFNSEADCYLALKKRFNLPTRDSAKVYMFSLMFGTKWGKNHKLFEEMFPQAGSVLSTMKSTYNPNNPNCTKGNFHSNVAYEMQMRETTIFRGVWKKINNKSIRFLTIHDAVLVPTKDIDMVKAIMQSYLSERFPTAQVNIKQYA